MKSIQSKTLSRILGTALVFLWAQSNFAADLVRYSSQQGSRIQISGTSTVHDWTMESALIGGFFMVDPMVDFDPSKTELTGAKDGKIEANVLVRVPVTSLRSSKDLMDDVMQQAMKADKHRVIEYKLKEMKVKPDHKAETPFAFVTKGDLTIAGVTKEITMDVTVEKGEKDHLKINGEKPMKMTDFEVTPPAPKLAFGLIKTGDDIKIQFEWLVAKPAAK